MSGPRLLGEGPVQKPGDHGKVLALVIGGEDDGVFVRFGGRHCCRLVSGAREGWLKMCGLVIAKERR
jgi:hypothetical protein